MPCGAYFIKDLKDLENGLIRVSIDIKDLKDLKRHRLTMNNAGETRSDARMASEGPRATEKSRPGGLSYPSSRATGGALPF